MNIKALVIVLAIINLVGCNTEGSSGAFQDSQILDDIFIVNDFNDNNQLPVGMIVSLKAFGLYRDEHTEDITNDVNWSVDTDSMGNVSVSNSGLVKGLHVDDDVTIKADLDGVIGTSTIIVTDAVLTKITISAKTSTIPTGGKKEYFAQGIYSDLQYYDITDYVTWSTTDNNIAKFDKKNVLTGRSVGESSVIAEYDEQLDEQYVSVKNIKDIDIIVKDARSLIKPTVSIKENTDLRLKLIATYEDDTEDDLDEIINVEWSTENEKVAMVSNKSILSAISHGDTSISAKLPKYKKVSLLVKVLRSKTIRLLIKTVKNIPNGVKVPVVIYAEHESGHIEDISTKITTGSVHFTYKEDDNEAEEVKYYESDMIGGDFPYLEGESMTNNKGIVMSVTYEGITGYFSLINVTDAIYKYSEIESVGGPDDGNKYVLVNYNLIESRYYTDGEKINYAIKDPTLYILPNNNSIISVGDYQFSVDTNLNTTINYNYQSILKTEDFSTLCTKTSLSDCPGGVIIVPIHGENSYETDEQQYLVYNEAAIPGLRRCDRPNTGQVKWSMSDTAKFSKWEIKATSNFPWKGKARVRFDFNQDGPSDSSDKVSTIDLSPSGGYAEMRSNDNNLKGGFYTYVVDADQQYTTSRTCLVHYNTKTGYVP